MKRVFALLILSAFAYQYSRAQTLADTISVVSESNLSFIHKGSLVFPNDLARICASNKEASSLLRAAQADRTVANVCGYIGGFCFGYGAVSLLFKTKAGLTLLIASTPFIAGGLLLEPSSKKKVLKAVKIYNASLK